MGIQKRTRKFAHVKRAISLRDNNLYVTAAYQHLMTDDNMLIVIFHQEGE